MPAKLQQTPTAPAPAPAAPSASAAPIIEVQAVSCTYGDYLALDDVSLSVRAGQVHALLGTNGAGKTTLLETAQGFRRPASGTLSVLGVDPWRQRTVVAGRAGVMLQESGLVDEMTVGSQLAMWQGVSVRQDSIARVLDLVGLQHRRTVPVAVLSGGERRRLDFAMAVWGNPELLVLDEPTTGLDPQSRRAMWHIIQELNAHGATVLLTTHYLDEAQSLAASVTILDRGRVAVEGTMVDVLATIPAQISFTVAASSSAIAELRGALTGTLHTAAGQHSSEHSGEPGRVPHTSVVIRTAQLQADAAAVIDWSRERGMHLLQLRCAPASLEEVFFDLPAATTRERS